jgi:uncharacterized protein YyaL (SSP411 family)
VAFDDPRFGEVALRVARSLRPKQLTDEDHALLVRALFDAYQVSFDVSLLERAMALRPNASSQVPEPVRSLAPAKPQIAIPSLDDFRQIVISGDPSREDTKTLIRAAREDGAMVFLLPSQRTRDRLAAWLPHVAEMSVGDEPQAAFCVRKICRPWAP